MMCSTCDEPERRNSKEFYDTTTNEPKCCCLPARELLIVWFCLSITDMARLSWHALVKPTNLMGSEYDELDFLSEFDQDYHFTKPSVTRVVSAKYPWFYVCLYAFLITFESCVLLILTNSFYLFRKLLPAPHRIMLIAAVEQLCCGIGFLLKIFINDFFYAEDISESLP